MLLLRLLPLLVVMLPSAALAHKPVFPDGGGPFEVDTPTVSKAYYLTLEAGERHTFVVPPLSRTVPIEVLVLDNELGRSLELVATASCGNTVSGLTRLDQPFYEPFSRLHHRYRVVDVLGPTEGPCRIEVRELEGRTAPYVFAVGDEERFGPGDMLGFLNLGRKLRAWQAGP